MASNWRDKREEEWVPPSERIGATTGSQAMARIKMFEKRKEEPRPIVFTKQSAVISNPVPSSKTTSAPSSRMSSPVKTSQKTSSSVSSASASAASSSDPFAHLNLDENYTINVPDEMYGRKLNEAEKLVLYKQEEEKMAKKRKINEEKKAEVRAALRAKEEKQQAAKKTEEEKKRIPVAALGSRFAELASSPKQSGLSRPKDPVPLASQRKTVSTPALRLSSSPSSSSSCTDSSPTKSRNTAASHGLSSRASTVSLGAGNDREMRSVRSMTSSFQKKAGVVINAPKKEEIPKPTSVVAAPAVKIGGDICAICQRPVYAMEMIKADKLILHKWCFRCHECNKKVTPGNYAAINGTIFCKPHFTQLFKLKGNYDEGFGGHQRKHDFIESDA